MADFLKQIGQGAVRNLVVNPATNIAGGFGSALQLLDAILRQTGAIKHAPQPQEVFPTVQSLKGRLSENLPEGFEGLVNPQSTTESLADILLTGLNPLNPPTSLSQVGNLARSNLFTQGGAAIGEKVAGPIGQLAGGVLGHQAVSTKGRIKELAPEVSRQLYTKAEEAAKGKSVSSNIIQPLKDKITKRAADLEKGLIFKKKPILKKQTDNILATLGKQNVDIGDIVEINKDLNHLGYESSISDYEKSFYRSLKPYVKQAINDYGKQVPEHGTFFNQAQKIHGFIKSDPEISTISKDISSKVGRLTGLKESAKKAINWALGEGSVSDIKKFADSSPEARSALWNLQIDLLKNDKTAALRGINLINKVASKYEKQIPEKEQEKPKQNNVQDLFRNAKNIEFLN